MSDEPRVEIHLDHVGWKSLVTVDGKPLFCTLVKVVTEATGVTTATITLEPDVVTTKLPTGAVEWRFSNPLTDELMAVVAQSHESEKSVERDAKVHECCCCRHCGAE